MAQNDQKSGAIKVLLIIVAAVLVVFICWKAGWILSGNKNEVSEQEKQAAIKEAVQEVNATMEEEQGTVREAESELQEMQDELQEVRDELRNAFQ